MFFEELLEIVGREPVFESGILLAGDAEPNYLRRQLSEWVAKGKLWQLRRGLYALAPPYQKVKPHPFLVANRIVTGSYVSMQAALAHYGLIPEYVATVSSVSTGRLGEWETPLGHYLFRHIRPELLFGYQQQQVDRKQFAFVATAEKALLDLVYLQPGGDAFAFLESLRLQNLELLDLSYLQQLAERIGKPKLLRATQMIGDIAAIEIDAFEAL